MFGCAYRKNKQAVHTVGELLAYLKDYPEDTPLESTFGDGILALKHENQDDPSEFSVCLEELEEDHDDE